MDEKKIIATVNILDRYTKLYKEISKGQFEDYETYFSHEFSDENELIKPKLWTDFLEKILDFPEDEYLPERPGITGKTPDFVPRDRRLHPFIFEIKGTDSRDLSSHYSQISDYIKPPIKWGVITNIRELITFENVSAFANQNIVSDYSFSFVQLYKDYKNHPKQILDFPNTKRFLDFVNRFKFQEIDFTKKIELIKSAVPWTGKEELNSDELIDTIRRITMFLAKDAQPRKEELIGNLKFNPPMALYVGLEFDYIACELDKGRVHQSPDTKAWEKFVYSQPNSLEARVLEIYFSRVAYFTMTRILLARLWEDIGFIDQSLYDGGFAKLYETFNRQIEQVLTRAFGIAGKRYSWLYNSANNYSWYTPSENTLIDVLYEFSRYNLGKLNTDVLGTVYEEYVDRMDRKNKGQYYTPREIIKLIWNRVGFINDEQFFSYENGKRKPKLIFDPATGSGGFLVEAARRIRETSHYNDRDFNDLIDIFWAIVMGLCGSEISIFAHYITEVNLLIQLTPIIKKILDTQKHLFNMPWVLSTIPWDSLGLELSKWDNLMNNNRDKGAKILVPFDQFKTGVYYTILACHEFDYVCANPPYIGEKGHKELFQSTKAQFPYWKQYYQGKMDYLYFFIILGLGKLKEGGKLGFITTSYWFTADGASNLRQYILDNALIKEIIDLGETKIFEGAPGQHNMVFVLEKCSSYSNSKGKQAIKENIAHKENNKIKIVKVKGGRDFPAVSGSRCGGDIVPKSRDATIPDKSRLTPLVEYIEKYIDKEEYSDEYIQVFYSAVRQGELTEKAWNTILSKTDVVKQSKGIQPLKMVLEVKEGIVPGIDRITEENIKLIPEEKVSREGIKKGNGIFILTEEEVKALQLEDKEKKLLVPSYRNSHISPYYVDIPSDERDYILYIDQELDLEKYPNIKKHLEKFKEVLKTRIERYEERGYKESYPWYRLNRPRDKKALLSEKIVVSNWGTSWQPFAYQSGEFFEKRDITFLTKQREVKESILYFLTLLNSNLIKQWMIEKARQLGYMRQSIQEQIPIRRINFKKPDEVKVHNKIVKKTESIITAKKKLVEYNNFFGIRLTKLDGPENLPEPDAYAITRSLPSGEQRILRTHPDIKLEPKGLKEFYLTNIGKTEISAPLFKKPDREQLYSLELLGKNREKAFIIATLPIINYLKEILVNYTGKSVDEIKEMLIAKDLKVHSKKRNEIIKEVTSLLTKVKNTQEQIDDIVYELYGITDKERKFIEAL